jgi:hypothetical protein
MAKDMKAEVGRKWLSAVAAVVGGTPPATAAWRNLDDIIRILGPFMGPAINHGLLPTGGGMDLEGVRKSRERGCLEFDVGSRTGYVMRPKQLTLEYVKEAPVESFLLLILKKLKPSGVYDDVEGNGREELLEVDDDYLDRSLLDRGYLRHDESRYEVPVPRDARIVCRFLKGSVMIVAKSSIWNGMPGTYDGEHDKMSTDQIREVIETLVLKRKSR